MRLAIRVFGLLLAVGFAWWAVQMVAAESGEVVIVTTIDSEGRPHETRLWIVDHAGVGWLAPTWRAGTSGSVRYPRSRSREASRSVGTSRSLNRGNAKRSTA